MLKRRESLAILLFHCGLALPAAWAGEGPFFVTYTHQLEEPGNLEIRDEERHRQAEEREPVSG